MKSYSTTFRATLNAATNTLATCWKITLPDDTAIAFTDFDRPLAIDGVTYQPEGGFQPSDIDRDLDFSPNQISVKSYFSQQLPVELFTSGQLRDASVFVFRVDPYNLPATLSDDPLTFDPLIRGAIGKITLTDQGYTAEVIGLQNRLATKQGWVTSSTCRNRFCDDLCGLDIANFTDTIAVASVSNQAAIAVTSSFADNFYTGGTLIWQTGGNIGIQNICTYSNGSTIRLLDPAPNPIQSGDTATITRACGKSIADCWRYGNGLRFNAEPGLPGADTISTSYNSDDKTN